MVGRSLQEDLQTDLEAQTWTNLGVQPNVKIGGRRGKTTGNWGVVVHEDDDDPTEYTTFAHSIVARDQDGTIEIWNRNNTDRQKMIDDIETILHSSSTTYNWLVTGVERQTLKNNLYQADIKIKRLLS